MINKVLTSFDEAVSDIPDGASIAIESWGIPATPQNLIAALKSKGVRDLTIVTHTFIPMVWNEQDAALPSLLLPQMKRLISAVIGIQRLGAGAFLQEYIDRGLEVEITSHGTLASRLYAGAANLGGFYNPVGVGTFLEEGKEKRVIDGREYIFEKPIRPDYAFISAHRADSLGNLTYRGNYRADSPAMAMAAKTTIAEVDQVVQVGDIDHEHVVTPGAFVDRIVQIPEDGLGSRDKQMAMVHMLSQLDSTRDLLFGRDK